MLWMQYFWKVLWLLMNLKLNALYCILCQDQSSMLEIDMYMQRTKLGKHFEDLGLADILLEAGTVYNRSVRVMKIMAEALRRKLLSTFMDTQWRRKKSSLPCLKVYIMLFPKTQFQHLCPSNDFKEFKSKLTLFIQEICSQFPTFAF